MIQKQGNDAKSLRRYSDTALPKCEGSKLEPFTIDGDVYFIRLLNTNKDEETSESGGHVHVFEVSMDGQIFALKVVRGTPNHHYQRLTYLCVLSSSSTMTRRIDLAW